MSIEAPERTVTTLPDDLLPRTISHVNPYARIFVTGTPQNTVGEYVNDYEYTGPDAPDFHIAHFDLVVTAFVGAPPLGTSEIRCLFNDSPLTSEPMQRLDATARHAANLHKRDGADILFRCHQGLNRSTLLAGMTMVRLGLSVEEIINSTRQYRDDRCFSNPWFVNHLYAYASGIDTRYY